MTRQLTLLAAFAIVTLLAANNNTQAAEPATGGRIPASLLAQLGLGDTQAMTDAEGEQIRL